MSNCAHLGKVLTQEEPQEYECHKFGRCTTVDNTYGMPACQSCKWCKLVSGDMSDFEDQLQVTTVGRQPSHALRGLLAGSPAFVVGGGPSLAGVPAGTFRLPGLFSIGVNNAAAMVRTSAFICSDPVGKFHSSIYTDPTMMKFIPIPKLKPRTSIRLKDDGEFVVGPPLVECPNVWGYAKRGWLSTDHTFFTEPSATIGNFDEGVTRFGPGTKKGVLTLLAAMRLAYYLGARTIFLVGCDFHMDEATPYAFGQAKAPGEVLNNNERYEIISAWLHDLRGTFREFGLTVYNTSPVSKLEAFPHYPLGDAVAFARVADNIDLTGWYEK